MKSAWNAAAARPDREPRERDYCWASELGKPLIDRYLAMRGTPPTNPPNARSRRKFLAGNFFEAFHGMVMKSLGLNVEQQEEVWTHGPLKVKGKLDFLVQGTPDYDRARRELAGLGMPDDIIGYLLSVVDSFEAQFGPVEFEPMVRECKSCSEFLMQHLQEGGRVLGHDLQLYHYLKGLNLPKGYIDYISKNDLHMEEVLVRFPDPALEARYSEDLSVLKEHLDSDTEPPPAALLVFENGKFKKNFDVEYSNYLTLIYGFQRPDEYAAAVGPKIRSWNYTLTRYKQLMEGKKVKLTDKNREVIKEMSREGWDAQSLAAQAVEQLEETEI